ncbi:MAG TPA: aminoacyl-tRNA hydrolase [Defluviitaleaceae bacterium]|jgi:PTH1 family peptidyl-tRNA hydrolase|nr:aminoacyl-tRNA hydrolase [Candidatus Epulonipiscium sp.]HOA80006.1 aminoacyl-tRNA hydrolase [Defluviitaleaceae bacterium]
MYAIIGLGNPGLQYAATRHNVGFEVIERLAFENNIDVSRKKFHALIGEGMIGGEKVILAKPQTYMNLSGKSVIEIINWYKLDPRNIIIIYDDISLPIGLIRVRTKGSDGGHNGIKNIISCLGSQEFLRVRVGVGEKPPGWDLSDYVLSRFTKEEIKEMVQSIKIASDAVETIIKEGPDKAMNVFNQKVRE